MEAISQQNSYKLSELIHPEPHFEFPYDLSNSNKSIREKNAIIDYLMDKRITRSFSDLRIIEQSIDGYTIAEMHAEEYYPLTNKTLLQDFICYVSFYEEKIKSYKEYFNPIVRLEGLLSLDNSDLERFSE